MQCQNKSEKESEQAIIIARTRYYYRQNNLLLEPQQVCMSSRTNKIKCQSKRKQLSKQDPIIYSQNKCMSSRIETSVVLEQIRRRVITSYYFSPNNILLYPKQLIIIARTGFYVISTKQNKVPEQMKTNVRTKSYYQNKFVCDPEQKQM
jgi:hypothetical protein